MAIDECKGYIFINCNYGKIIDIYRLIIIITIIIYIYISISIIAWCMYICMVDNLDKL